MDINWKELRETRILVTPDLAKQWLERNKNNRRLDKDRVSDLAATIKRGHWEYNGQSISFDSSGVLLDGQHRLSAIVAANLPCELLVCFGLKRRAAYTQDIGNRRSLSEQARREGSVPQPALVTKWAQTWGRLSKTLGTQHHKWSAIDLRTWYKSHKVAIDWLLAEKPAGAIFRAPICVVFIFAFEAKPERAMAFLSYYKKGTGLSEDDPVYLLREQALRPRTGGHVYQRIDAERAAAAISAFFRGEKRAVLKASAVALADLFGTTAETA